MRAACRWFVPWVACGLLASGCATGKRDLRPRDYWPGKAQWKRSALRALKDRGTWIPAAGAAVVSIDDWDRKISDWAVRETPLFGSNAHALEASSNLRTSTSLSLIGTSLAVPSGAGAWERKHERLFVGLLGVQLNNLLTGRLKDWTARERPDGSNDRSFPSGHASQAFARAAFSCLNVDDLGGLSRGERLTLKTTFRTLAGGTAWARVEGGVHYPSDVLFGASLGNFVAILIHDAFLPGESNPRWEATIDRRQVSFSFTFSPGSRELRSRGSSGRP